MSGGGSVPPARVRIKGRKASVVRFFTISTAHSLVWVVILSQMGHYSRLYGPQVLLQLNIAYYLPSIPALVLLAKVERRLDARLGTTASMAARLATGLTGCAAITAAFPFIPARLLWLLWTVVALGAISAVAFSTSYQLVAWFRSADTIALGIGHVASGPLALLLQLALGMSGVGAPKRWQWVALFECAAGMVVLGLLASASLFWQYWGVLTGKEAYGEAAAPLLTAAERDDDERVEARAQAILLPPALLSLAEPIPHFPFSPAPGRDLVLPILGDQLKSGTALRRAASAESDLFFSDWNRRPVAGDSLQPHLASNRGRGRPLGRSRTLAVRFSGSAKTPPLYPVSRLPDTPPGLAPLPLGAPAFPLPARAGGGHGPEAAPGLGAQGGAAWRASGGGGGGGMPLSEPGPAALLGEEVALQEQGTGGAEGSNGGGGAPGPLASPFKQLADAACAGDAATAAPAAVEAAPGPWPGLPGAAIVVGGDGPELLGHSAPSTPHQEVPGASSSVGEGLSRMGDSPSGGSGSADGGAGRPHRRSFTQTGTWEVFCHAWQVVVAGLLSSTLLNCAFPFFTYVPSSGWAGEALPQILFYGRMFADVLGRMLPRAKLLQTSSPLLLLAIAVSLSAGAALFFIYLQSPPELQSDPAIMALVALMWIGGGYINTVSYILAPALVPHKRVAKASALMALTYQVAHILGLMAATGLALLMYGDISGDL